MTAIGWKQNTRYLIRLFGYLLGLAVIGGGLTAGGVYLLDESEALPGGPGVDVGVELAGGIALTAVGVLVILAGLFVIVLNVVADGVRLGVAASDERTMEEETSDDESEAGEKSAMMEFAPGATASGGRQSEETDEPEQPATATAGDDERWKQEVEAKLADAERERSWREDGSEQGKAVSEPSQDDGTAESFEGPEDEPAQPSMPYDEGSETNDEWVSGEDIHGEADHGGDPPHAGGIPQDTDEWSDDAANARQNDEQEPDPLAPDRIEPHDDTRSDQEPAGDVSTGDDGDTSGADET